MVTNPLSAIDKYALILNHSEGTLLMVLSGEHDINQLNPRINPPPDAALALRNDLRLYDVFMIDIIEILKKHD